MHLIWQYSLTSWGGEINIKRMELITLEINNKKVHHPNI